MLLVYLNLHLTLSYSLQIRKNLDLTCMNRCIRRRSWQPYFLYLEEFQKSHAQGKMNIFQLRKFCIRQHKSFFSIPSCDSGNGNLIRTSPLVCCCFTENADKYFLNFYLSLSLSLTLSNGTHTHTHTRVFLKFD